MNCIICGKKMRPTTGGNYECYTCGVMSTGLLNNPSNCDIPMPQGFGEQKGWICPVCGRGLAPWADYCPCQSDFKITYETNIGINGFASIDETMQWIKEHTDQITEELK